MQITRAWAMPNSSTFSIRPIEVFIKDNIAEYKGTKSIDEEILIIDPFCNGRTDIANINNDLNIDVEADCHMDALEFVKMFDDNSVDGVLFDPPYSARQVSECYKKMDMTVNMQTTQSSFWGNIKKEVGRIVKDKGFCITFGWNSGGIGKKYGFEIDKILLVAHGGWHNDTICTLERRNKC